MARQALAKIVDPDALDASQRCQGRLRIKVPAAWLQQAARIEVLVPSTLTCARCDGGGCDSCNRSGALKPPESSDERRLCLRLPRHPDGPVTIRLVRPFAESEIEQLLVEVEPSERASKNVTPLPATKTRPKGGTSAPSTPAIPNWVLLVAAVIVAALFALILADR